MAHGHASLVSQPFNVLKLSPALWLDASDSSTITASSGSVSQWNDKSGNGRNVTQATSANQPATGTTTQNSLNVMSFGGSAYLSGGDILDILTGGVTTIGVVKFNTTGAGTPWAKSRQAEGQGRYSIVRNGGLLDGLYAESTTSTDVTVSDTSTAVRVLAHRVKRNATGGTELFINGTSQGSKDTSGTASRNSTDLFLVGAYPNSTGTTPPASGLNLNGFIAEMFVFLRDLTNTELTAMTNYLNAKWAVY